MKSETKPSIAPFAPSFLAKWSKALLHSERPSLKIWYNFSPPFLTYMSGEVVYKVMPNGQTFLLTPGIEEGIPVTGCPIPEALMWANFQFFLYRYRKAWPALIMVCLLIVLLQFFLWFVPDSPLVDLKLSFISTFTFWMNTALIILFSGSVIMLALHLVFGPVRFKWVLPDLMPEPSLIESGFSIGPDFFIYSESETESITDFKARVTQAQEDWEFKDWIVVIAFQNPSGLILRKGPTLNEPYLSVPFQRDNPPFQNSNFQFEPIVEKGRRFRNETWNEYQKYLKSFAFHFPEFAKTEKLKHGDPLEQYFNTM